MLEVPEFDEFYKELHGYPPFPWQARLAQLVSETGRWPANIGVPTGLGKTSTLTVAVWTLAGDAGIDPAQRQTPRRIWYVVNRRMLVDAALDHALHIQSALKAGSTPAVAAVAACLSDLGAVKWEFGPLHVARLRGGAEQGLRPPDPSCPSLILSTVPMFGSRMLFRGYGCSSGMRSIDAAHAGIDALVLLDEAHLARPLQNLLAQREELAPAENHLLSPARRLATLVNLTATGAASSESFDLDDSDRTHPIVSRRLSAAKPTVLVSVRDSKVAGQLASQAMDVVLSEREEGRQPAVVIFVNTAKRVPLVNKALAALVKKSLKGDADITVLTGRLRPFDAADIRRVLLEGDSATGIQPVKAGVVHDRSRPLFVIATQTLEVGADVDFDILITESAGVRALTQRFGRLNRLGDRPWAQGCVIHAEDKKDFPVYGIEPITAWDRLSAAQDTTGSVDLSPAEIHGVLGEPADEPPMSPQLLPNHVWEWAKTTMSRPGEPDVAPFINGIEDERTVTVVWRDALPLNSDGEQILAPVVHPSEAVEIPVGEVRRLFEERTESEDVILDQAYVLDYDGARTLPLEPSLLKPGRVVVLPGSFGGYCAETGWDSSSVDAVNDLSFKLRGEIVLSARTLIALYRKYNDLSSDEIADIRSKAGNVLDEADNAQRSWSGSHWVGGLGVDSSVEPIGLGQFGELIGQFFKDVTPVERPLGGVWTFRKIRNGPVMAAAPVATGTAFQWPRVEADDGLSLAGDYDDGEGRFLSVHGRDVGDLAERMARAVGFTDDVIEAVALAGRLHDIGKADPRFQALLGMTGDVLLAKSSPNSSGSRALWPRGARHEMVSGLLVDEWLSIKDGPGGVDLELVRHLVLSHHGKARPLISPIDGGGIVTVRMTVEEVDVKIVSDLSATDWDQPARFFGLCGKYGHWGLALLEATLRQADHAVSAKSRMADTKAVGSDDRLVPTAVMEVL